MSRSDPRPLAKRCFVEKFVGTAVGLGYTAEQARAVWPRLVRLLNYGRVTSMSYVTVGELVDTADADKGIAQFPKMREEQWAMLVDIANELKPQ